MNRAAPWAALGLLRLAGNQQTLAQTEACGDDYVCVAEELSAAIAHIDRSPAIAKLPTDPRVRETFLHSFDQIAIADKSPFNDPVLFFDPYFFAARAYHHFKASPNGCTHLTALLEGEVSFIAPQM